MVTTRCKFPGPLDSLSILVYNFDDNVIRVAEEDRTRKDLLRIIRNYDGEAEFLVRCNGLRGQFRVLRCRMDRENLISKIEVPGQTGQRERPRTQRNCCA